MSAQRPPSDKCPPGRPPPGRRPPGPQRAASSGIPPPRTIPVPRARLPQPTRGPPAPVARTAAPGYAGRAAMGAAARPVCPRPGAAPRQQPAQTGPTKVIKTTVIETHTAPAPSGEVCPPGPSGVAQPPAQSATVMYRQPCPSVSSTSRFGHSQRGQADSSSRSTVRTVRTTTTTIQPPAQRPPCPPAQGRTYPGRPPPRQPAARPASAPSRSVCPPAQAPVPARPSRPALKRPPSLPISKPGPSRPPSRVPSTTAEQEPPVQVPADAKLIKKATSITEKKTEPDTSAAAGPCPEEQPLKVVTTTTTVEEFFEHEKPSPEEVRQMVKDEAREIKETMQQAVPEIKTRSPEKYPLKKKLDTLKAEQVATQGRPKETAAAPPPDVPQEEMQPETVAQIMHNQEKGMKMEATPDHLYNYLFPQDRENVVQISSVAQGPMQNAVVPSEVPTQIHQSVLTKEDLQKTIGNMAPATLEKPSDSRYSETVMKNTQQLDLPNTTVSRVRRGRRPPSYPMLADISPPWIGIDINAMRDITGADPVPKPPPRDQLMMEETILPSTTDPNNLEYYLAMEPPRHYSCVQLRGSEKPSWFPGYLVALPEIPELVKVARSPSGVLAAAWRSVQPNIFDEDSFSMA